MTLFKVKFKYFSHFEDAYENYSTIIYSDYEATNIQEVLDTIEEEQEFDDSEAINYDAESDMIEAGRNIITIKDNNGKTVYPEKSNGNYDIAFKIHEDILDYEQEAWAIDYSKLPDECKEYLNNEYPDLDTSKVQETHVRKYYHDHFREALSEIPISDWKLYVAKNDEDWESALIYYVRFQSESSLDELQDDILELTRQLDLSLRFYESNNMVFQNFAYGELDSGSLCDDDLSEDYENQAKEFFEEIDKLKPDFVGD